MHNAFVHLDEGQLEKASEFLWGCMAQAIKAVAALKGIELPTHAAIWEFMTRLCKDLGDPTLFEAFRDANRLHSNFYEAGLTREMVMESEERIRYGVARLLGMIPREALGQ